MDHQSNNPHHTPRKILKPRRLALLASVAGLGMAVLLVGPGGFRPFSLPAAAHAAEMAQNPAGFADLVAKVKPAVISVRVKIDDNGDNTALLQRNDQGTDSDQSVSP